MNDLVERLRHWTPIDLEDARWMRNAAADRIEALEAALREAEAEARSLADELNACEQLRSEAAARIEQLEAVLRVIAKHSHDAVVVDLARAALEQSSPPKAST